MTKVCGTKTKVFLLSLLSILVALSFFPATILAAQSNPIASIDIVVDIEENGNALVTEVWTVDIRDSSTTELYTSRTDMQNKTLYDLVVSENGVTFNDVGEWDPDASRAGKTQKSGIATLKNGYELCWGVGSNGKHEFVVQYRVGNLVQSATDANFFNHVFVPELNNPIDSVSIKVRGSGLTFTPDNTKIWAGGGASETNITVQNGEIYATSSGSGTFYRIAILAQFEEGMFAPTVSQNKSFEKIKDGELKGTDYDSASTTEIKSFFRSIFPFVAALIGLLFWFLFSYSHRMRDGDQKKMKKIYKDVDYCRELPYEGKLVTSYARLTELSQLSNESDIIGSYLLRWIRSGQVQIATEAGGFFGNKEQDTIVMRPAALNMENLESRLYGMMVQAAGSDGVLQSKEFERWSKSNYQKVQGWLQSYKNAGLQNLRTLGSIEKRKVRFFGIIPGTATMVSPKGDEMTKKMLGFKKYLLDFTIINEREAREVQLWDEYLVFAQLFGIADQVAEQFKKLYPNYFIQMSEQMGGVNMYDVIVYRHITRSYSRAMYNGYRSGYSASVQAQRSSGGGGGFSGGGGGFGGAGGGSGGSR